MSPNPGLSKQISQQPEPGFDVEKIVCNDWWQGSVLILPEDHCDPHFEGHSCWVLASQTCNAQNPDIARVPTVEFIRAYVLDSAELDGRLIDGSNPRQLHATATNALDGFLNLEFRIAERVWVPRRRLMDLRPSDWRLEDSENDASKRAKEAFASWLARSYVRVELPNDFIELFVNTKLKNVFAQIVKKHAGKIQGVYLDLRPRSDDSDTRYSPTQVARFSAPYQLHVTVVVLDSESIAAVEDALAELEDKRIPKPNAGKISRVQHAAEMGLDLTTDVVMIDGWTVRDLMATVRFTDWDYLSGIDESSP